jgi:tensin
LNNIDVESLSGQMAVAKALRSTFDNAERLQATIVNFKVSSTGITLTDTKKKYAFILIIFHVNKNEKFILFRLFSRRHFPKEYITYCGADYETDRFWTYQFNDLDILPRAK